MINSLMSVPAPIYGNLVESTTLNGIFPVTDIMPEIILIIFQNLSFKKFVNCCLVSKDWNRLTNDQFISKHMVFQKIAFNPAHWNTYCGEGTVDNDQMDKAFRRLPNNIWEILKSPCPAFPGQRIMDTQMLVWIPEFIKGEALTIESFGELLKQKFEFFNHNTNYIQMIWQQTESGRRSKGFGKIRRKIAVQEGNKPINSGFVLMTTDILKGSRAKTHAHAKIPDDFEKLNQNNQTDWRTPKLGEAIVCIMSEYLRSGKRFFNENPITFTRCEEIVSDHQVFVGDFRENSGLEVDTYASYASDYNRMGVAALWLLSKQESTRL